MEIINPSFSNLVAFTPVIAVLTPSTKLGVWRREGDCLYAKYFFQWAGADSFAANYIDVQLPGSFLMDAAKIPDSTTGRMNMGTTGNFFDSAGGTTNWIVVPKYKDSNEVRLYYAVQVSGASTIVYDTPCFNNAPFTPKASDYLAFDIKVPISGWSF